MLCSAKGAYYGNGEEANYREGRYVPLLISSLGYNGSTPAGCEKSGSCIPLVLVENDLSYDVVLSRVSTLQLLPAILQGIFFFFLFP